MFSTALLLPTDNRPITYIFPQLICQMANLDILVPPRELMGSLQAPSDLSLLDRWMKGAVDKIQSGVLLICLDSLLYGGLIPARRSEDSLEIILERAAIIAEFKKQTNSKVKIYAQSSIMRISDNYDNSEEKLYWSEYGREIFLWSQLLHKKEIGILKSEIELKAVESTIKYDVRADYLATRARNFAVNKKLIDYVVSQDLDFLIFSQDDSGEYGLNVLEKDQLLAFARAKKADNVLAYPGADEMLMTLIARYLNNERANAPKVTLQYTAVSGKNIASNYEGQSIGSSMECQTNAQGLKIVDTDIANKAVDFHIIVHSGSEKQGDHIWLPGLPDLRQVDSADSARKAIQLIEEAQAPVVLCDLAYSNGSDPALIALLLERPQLFNKIWSYAGWNTTGNAIGCALAIGSACLHACSSKKGLNDLMRKQLLFIRLMDDWAYQTNVRKEIQTDKIADEHHLVLSRSMSVYALQLAKALNFDQGTAVYTLPWRRSFEIEINLGSRLVAADN